MLIKRLFGPITSTLRWSSLRTELYAAYEGNVEECSINPETGERRGYWVRLVREGTVFTASQRQSRDANKRKWIVSRHSASELPFASDSCALAIHFRAEWCTGEELFPAKDVLIFDSFQFPRLERSAFQLTRLICRNAPAVRLDLPRQPTEYPAFLRIQVRFVQWLIDFYQTMIALDQQPSRGLEGDGRVSRTVELLKAAPIDGGFPIGQLMRETSLGRGQLDRLFCREFGVSTWEYWERQREAAAMICIEDFTLSVKEISFRLGFRQASAFSKWFTKRVGISPLNYRKQSVKAIPLGPDRGKRNVLKLELLR